MILTAIRDGVLEELKSKLKDPNIPPCILEASDPNVILLVSDWEDDAMNWTHNTPAEGRQIGVIVFSPNLAFVRCHRPGVLWNLEYYDPTMLDRLLDIVIDCIRNTKEYDERAARRVRPNALAGITPKGAS